jgi:hypothetical protein
MALRACLVLATACALHAETVVDVTPSAPRPPAWERRYEPTPQPFEWQLALGLPYLLFCMLNRVLPSWLSRKGIHVGMGVMLVHSDVEGDWRMRAMVHLVAWGFLALAAAAAAGRVSLSTHLRFLHAQYRFDPGVCTYLLTCSLCVALGVRFVDMAPLFFADPMGAIVGRNWKTPRLVGAKTCGGTLAVWLTAFVTWNAVSLWSCAVGASAIAVVELFGGEYDNPAIAVLLLVRALGW